MPVRILSGSLYLISISGLDVQDEIWMIVEFLLYFGLLSEESGTSEGIFKCKLGLALNRLMIFLVANCTTLYLSLLHRINQSQLRR